MSQCPCGSNKPFNRCCRPFLDGNKVSKTPERLMRSRYAAFSLGGYGQYLYDSWHPSTVRNTVVDLNQNSTDWHQLEILNKSQKGHQGWVEFNAWYKDDDGQLHCMHEKSEFEKIQGQWLYVKGEVTTN